MCSLFPSHDSLNFSVHPWVGMSGRWERQVGNTSIDKVGLTSQSPYIVGGYEYKFTEYKFYL